MEFVPCWFFVDFQEYRDRSVEFTIKCAYKSTEPVGGRYQWHTLTL